MHSAGRSNALHLCAALNAGSSSAARNRSHYLWYYHWTRVIGMAAETVTQPEAALHVMCNGTVLDSSATAAVLHVICHTLLADTCTSRRDRQLSLGHATCWPRLMLALTDSGHATCWPRLLALTECALKACVERSTVTHSRAHS
jgi:hypothetical protein